MRSFFFGTMHGIVIENSVRSGERTIVPQERRPALIVTINTFKDQSLTFTGLKTFKKPQFFKQTRHLYF